MTLIKNYPNRQSIRYQHYDYSSAGIYFITICCQDFKHRFGVIKNGFMCLNKIGQIVQESWLFIAGEYGQIELNEFQIMPNHFHGIIIYPDQFERFEKSITALVGEFKSKVFHESLKMYKSEGLQMGKLWQRNFYEHIVRDYKDLVNCQAYIRNNPESWSGDCFNK